MSGIFSTQLSTWAHFGMKNPTIRRGANREPMKSLPHKICSWRKRMIWLQQIRCILARILLFGYKRCFCFCTDTVFVGTKTVFLVQKVFFLYRRCFFGTKGVFVGTKGVFVGTYGVFLVRKVFFWYVGCLFGTKGVFVGT